MALPKLLIAPSGQSAIASTDSLEGSADTDVDVDVVVLVLLLVLVELVVLVEVDVDDVLLLLVLVEVLVLDEVDEGSLSSSVVDTGFVVVVATANPVSPVVVSSADVNATLAVEVAVEVEVEVDDVGHALLLRS